MESVLHLVGACSDNHSHLDLSDVLLGGTAAGGALVYLKYYWTAIKFIVKDFFTNLLFKDKK